MTKPKGWIKEFTAAHLRYFAVVEAEIDRHPADPGYQEQLREFLRQEKHKALTVKNWRAPRSRDMRHLDMWL